MVSFLPGPLCCTCWGVANDVRKLFHETVPAAWPLEEAGSRRQAPRIATMATRFLVATGHIVLPVDYLFFPLQEAARTMDRFVPSSKQPQHWSRNYNGSQENRRRSSVQSRVSPDIEANNASSYVQGITLRAEDLLGESDSRFSRATGVAAINFLSPRPDDRRAALGGSATELAQCDRPRAPLRRSSEGNYALRRKSSSSSNAADDPTSSDPSNTSCTASSSSSSESGCNGDSETCHYCRLSESSGDSYECRDSTDDERSSSSLEGSDRRRPHLKRALSEDCNPPSRAHRPLRRTSPGEYLRHKRIQMEKLRNERRNLSPERHSTSRITFQRCDSDPRLCLKRSPRRDASHNRTLTFVSPTKNRIKQSQNRNRTHRNDNPNFRTVAIVPSTVSDDRKRRQKDTSLRISRQYDAATPDAGGFKVPHQCDDDVPNAVSDEVSFHTNEEAKMRTGLQSDAVIPYTQSDNRQHRKDLRSSHRSDAIIPDNISNEINYYIKPVVEQCDASSINGTRRQRSALAKNVAERRSRSIERRPSVVWNSEDSTPFLECGGATFHCTVCELSIPFTNCALCGTDTEVCVVENIDVHEIVALEGELRTQRVDEEPVCSGDRNSRDDKFAKSDSQSSEEKKELEMFYDSPSQPHTPPIVATKDSPEDKKGQWASRGAIHKSFNQEDARNSRRRNSQCLRKYNSEPVPEAEVEEYYIPSRSQPEFTYFRKDHPQLRGESSSSSSSRSSRSGKKSGYHIAKDSPKRSSAEEEGRSSCQTCDKNTEEESSVDTPKARVLSPDVVVQDKNQRKSPVFLKPEFVFEPEIIHKANPLVDEADVEVLPSAIGAFRRLSEDEFISTLNIHEAARKGDLHVVKLLTKKDPKQMETVDERGWTPIHLAAAYGHAEVVRYLATEGAHLAALDPSSYTAVHLAAMNGHSICLEVLLPMGVDIDSTTSEGFTPLHLAVMNGHLECIRTLLRWGSNMDKRDSLGRGINDMVEEYKLEDVAVLLRRYHKKMHNVKHMLEIFHRDDDRNTTEIPQEFIDILASIAEESGTD